jgi:hypothetical protein
MFDTHDAPNSHSESRLARHGLPPLPQLARHFTRYFVGRPRAALADWLGLPADCLDLLPGIGYVPTFDEWAFPETDAAGAVVGLTCRSSDRPPTLFPDSRRGLSITAGWADRPGPVFLPFGPFDALALAAVGLSAIGRPGEDAAADEMVELLRPLDPARPVVVVGVNGCDGPHPDYQAEAMLFAELLAEQLGRPVRWAVPPPDFVSLLDWVADRFAHAADRGLSDPAAEIGEFVARYLADAASGGRQASEGRNTPGADDPHTPCPTPPAIAPHPIALPLPASALVSPGRAGVDWVLHGFLARDAVTLLSALPKCGKSTLIAHLLAALPHGGSFLGRPLAPGRAVVVSEESEGVWAARRDALGLTDAVRIIPRGHLLLPTHDEWRAFIARLNAHLEADPADVVFFDSLAAIWPVRDENNAAEVCRALAPLHRLCRGRAVGLSHHIRKSDGRDGTAARGSGALAAFVDVMLELRRVKAGSKRNHRVITGFGRFDDTPDEWVIELVPGDPPRYEHRPPTAAELATLTDDGNAPLRVAILAALPKDGTPLTRKEIWDRLPHELRRGEGRFITVLEEGSGTLWFRTGRGGRYGFQYAAAGPPANFSISQPLGI